jgi:hypothetical protein
MRERASLLKTAWVLGSPGAEEGDEPGKSGRPKLCECFMYIKMGSLPANKLQTKNSGY